MFQKLKNVWKCLKTLLKHFRYNTRMNTVDLVIEGQVKVTKTGWNATATTCLITTDSGIKIITDPGANRELLLAHLEKMNVQTSDIEYVFLTHLHLDHSLLMGIFENAKIITFEAITDGEKGELVPAMIPNTDISIIKTPGHEYAGASLLVPTDKGTVGIVGDIFWWEDGEEEKIDTEKKDDFATDMELLIKSRKEVLQLCDFIVPGHGKMFQVDK